MRFARSAQGRTGRDDPRLRVKLGELCPGPVGKTVRIACSVEVGSLASCPACGGLVSLFELAFDMVSARHLTGDVSPASCPRRGLAWSQPGLYDLGVEREA